MNRKDFSVDWDSFDEVSRFFNKSKTRYHELKRIKDNVPSRKVRNSLVFESANRILATDISALYSSLELDTRPQYYVYFHCDTSFKIAVGMSPITTFGATLGLTYQPFYVGKGTGNRAQDTSRSETHRKIKDKLKCLGKEIIVHIYKTGLTESAALQLESKLIDIFGLLPQGGMLSNLDEGQAAKERRALYTEDLHNLREINKILYTH